MRILYVSYDGAGEPLGQSQIVAYLERLAGNGTDIHLVSFEKEDSDLDAVRKRLAQAGIGWTPLRYHRRPPVLSTLWDVVRGAWAIERVSHSIGAPEIVHVRSDVPALMARWSPAARRSRLLFDIRGFWADERVDGGIWNRGALYRFAKSRELRLFAAADAIVTLTDASVPQIRRWLGDRETPIRVIPTCADVGAFASTAPRSDGPHVTWSGSISTWYRFDLAIRLAHAIRRPVTVLTHERGAAERALSMTAPGLVPAATVRTVPAREIPSHLHVGDIGLCLVRSSFSKVASAPTRFAEFLAAGMPVAVTPGVGDLEAFVERHAVGVVIRDESDEALAEAAEALLSLAGDADACERCRHVARDHFDVDEGVRRYADVYAMLSDA